MGGAAAFDGALSLAPLAGACPRAGPQQRSLLRRPVAGTGVCLTPGIGFGPGGEGWLRLALVHPLPILEEAAARMGRWLATL